MPKNIVICCDGTGNEIGVNLSNVLKLYRVVEKSARQHVFYHPGIGTIGLINTWQRIKQETYAVFSLATGYGLDDDTLDAYRFLCETWQDGDEVFLFGFSRGAYTVRVLAAFIEVMGLLKVDQINLAPYAFNAYKKASLASQRSGTDADTDPTPLEEAWHFSRVAGARAIRLAFVGVWDTVASIIVPRRSLLQTLRYTRTNPAVKSFRQAIAIDERRRMFRLNRWTEPQIFRENPFDPASEIAQDIRQVWFAGCHSDIGGGFRETESGLSKFPLLWMIEQAAAQGLRINRAMVNHLGWGLPRRGSNHTYVPPDATAPLHDSMTGGWPLLEWIPKQDKWKEWPQRKSLLGWYLPCGEPRPIPDGALIHRSVIERRDKLADYRPINLPPEGNYEIADEPEARPIAGAHEDNADEA